MLTAVSDGKINNATIQSLSGAVRLLNKLKLSVNTLATLWGDMDTYGKQSLYHKLFLNKSVRNIDTIFEDEDGNFLSLDKALKEHIPAMLAVFKISDNELSEIIKAVELEKNGDDDVKLNLSNVSAIYRHVTLSKALGLNTEGFFLLLELYGKDPFRSAIDTLEFTKWVEHTKQARFTPSLLNYITTGNLSPESKLGLDNSKIENTLNKLNSRLDTIDNQYPDESNTALTADDIANLVSLTYERELVEVLVKISLGEDVSISESAEDFITSNFSYFLSEALISELLGDKNETEKLQIIYENYIPELKEELKKTTVIEEMAELIGLSQGAVNALFSDDKIKEIIADPSSIFIDEIGLWHRAALFIATFKLSDTEIHYFNTNADDFDGIDFQAVNINHWNRMYAYTSLKNSVPENGATLIDVFKTANNSAFELEGILEQAILASNWSMMSLEAIVSKLSFTKADFKNEIALYKVNKIMQVVYKSGLPVSVLNEMAQTDLAFEAYLKMAATAKHAVKAKYDEAEWLKIAADLSNKLRENQNKALVSYLLTEQNLIAEGIKTADNLFEYFLIDVQMGACMDTSRIVQANAAIQMFVQRCLLNLEKDIESSNIERGHWEWMKNYRVWEANRKVFLYPENWLEPEWRDDRSEFFKELESEVMQDDITEHNVETAFRSYLTKLNTVSNLDVCGMYEEKDDDGNMRKIHVFGHTNNAPYQFFYRTCDQFFKWSPWEKVPLDIRFNEDGENSGVHLIPVVWKNRLILFWPEFIEKQEEVKTSQTPRDAFNKEIGALQPEKYWEIRLAWSEYDNGKWMPKQLTNEFIKSNSRIESLKEIKFKLSMNSDRLRITPTPYTRSIIATSESGSIKEHRNLEITKINKVFFSFEISNLSSKVNVTKVPELVENPREIYGNNYQESLSNFFQKYEFKDKLILNGITYLKSKTHHTILSSSNRSKVVTPFLFQNDSRSYFVKKGKKVSVIDGILNPKIIAYGNNNSSNKKNELAREGSETHTDGIHFSIASISSSLGDVSMGFRDRVSENPPTGLVRYDMSEHIQLFERYIDFKKVDSLVFNTFHNPYTGEFTSLLNKKGVSALLNADLLKIEGSNDLVYNDKGKTFESYQPNFNFGLVKRAPHSQDYIPGKPYTYYKENICFDLYGANSMYNWELFYHAPLYIATRLSKNGKYKEAMKWFHYIFDPTTDAPKEDNHKQVWKTLPFKTTPAQSLIEMFTKAADTDALDEPIDEWRDNPFSPFTVARNRPLAFMKHVVVKYIENITEWADSLFRQFTRESVYEALQLYVVANHILGPKPEFIPKRGEVKAETYDSLKEKLDNFSNALVEMENIFPFTSDTNIELDEGSPLLGIGEVLYFCIPDNGKLLDLWETVSDRLFKIRNCMDIDGVKRQLALFAPPIDPALLINAKARGLSLADVLNDLSTPPPIYRFSYMLQRANEFCNEVKSLGNAMLSAIEKRDNEELSRIRATHEINMLELMTGIKERQVMEAKIGKEALLKSRETAAFRLKYYAKKMSDEEMDVPEYEVLDGNINSNSQLPTDTSISELTTDVEDSLVEFGGRNVSLIPLERQDLRLNRAARWMTTSASSTEALAGVLAAIPQFKVITAPLGAGGEVEAGGEQASSVIRIASQVLRITASHLSMQATSSQKIASYIRREQEWTFQANMAAKEIIQLDKQLASADIRIQVAEKELENHRKQIENAEEVKNYLTDKFSNTELYQWMKEQLFSVYRSSYNLAFELAKKAEKCYQYELGDETASFVDFGYWESTQQGLCSGEKLQLALREMEASYLEDNKRELELTKHISMALINPMALEELKASGSCLLDLPEELFDMDYQGHYFRRVKSVSISLPCVAGPYTTINCTLRLVKNATRIKTTIPSEYAHNQDADGIWIEDDRFRESIVPVKAIATSSGNQDSGLFELNFRDERYLPFEGAGVISQWKLELTEDSQLRQFDYSTISDVIIHLNYTARESLGIFKNKVTEHLKTVLSETGLLATVSLKSDMTSQWHLLKKEGSADIVINKLRLSYIAQSSESVEIESIMVVTKVEDDSAQFTINVDDISTDLIRIDSMKLYRGMISDIKLDTGFTLSIENTKREKIEELLFIIKYKF